MAARSMRWAAGGLRTESDLFACQITATDGRTDGRGRTRTDAMKERTKVEMGTREEEAAGWRFNCKIFPLEKPLEYLL